MDTEKDWLSYLFQPDSLSADLDHLPDDTRVSLMKHFLSQAELHERRIATHATDTLLKQTLVDMGLPDDTNSTQSTAYDKSKTLDNLALQIAASFNFNVNLFASPVNELPFRLATRLYRTLFLTLLEKNSYGAKDNGNGACTTPYDLGPWESLEATLAFAALAFHLWCLQVCL